MWSTCLPLQVPSKSGAHDQDNDVDSLPGPVSLSRLQRGALSAPVTGAEAVSGGTPAPVPAPAPAPRAGQQGGSSQGPVAEAVSGGTPAPVEGAGAGGSLQAGLEDQVEDSGPQGLKRPGDTQQLPPSKRVSACAFQPVCFPACVLSSLCAFQPVLSSLCACLCLCCEPFSV